MANAIAIIIIVALLGLAVYILYRNRKNGNKCIGCSSAGACQKHSACKTKTK